MTTAKSYAASGLGPKDDPLKSAELTLLPRLTDQHGVAGRIAPGTNEIFSVARPGKSIHQAVFKLRELFGLTTGDWLAPERLRDVRLLNAQAQVKIGEILQQPLRFQNIFAICEGFC